MRKIIPALILLITTGCGDENIRINDQSIIIFGQFYGFCMGEKCIEIFKLTDSALFEDSKDIYPSDNTPYDGNFTRLDEKRFNLVKGLRNQIPKDLLEQETVRIGQPDAGDWGGYYIEVNEKGERKFWLLDKNQMNLPESLKPFADLLGNYVNLISD
jgi:hypothetical protein